MANDNTLGVPTEGLGQKITFAFDGGSAIPSMSLGSTGDIQAGVKGGGAANPGATQNRGVKMEENPTFDFIFGLADKVIKVNAARKKQAAFVTGMQRAAAGEAVADIAAEQPWYSRLFGDSDTVEGARQYASHTIAQTSVAEMEEAMPKLRQMDAAEAQKYFTDSVQSKMTGDAATDASVMSAMARALPGVMKRQAKEHYGWQQENATKQETAAFRAGAVNLQAMAKALGPDFRTHDDFKVATNNFVASMIPAQGRDVDNYKLSMTNNLRLWAQEGNFHALNAVRDSGFMQILDADQVASVDKAVEAGENKLRTKYSFDWNDKLTTLAMAADEPPIGSKPRDLANEVDTLNREYSLATGSRQGLITPEMRTAYISRSGRNIRAELDRQASIAAHNAEKLAEKGDKAAAEAAMDQQIQLAFASGTLGTLSTNKDYGRTRVDSVVYPLWQKMSPDDQVKALALNGGQENYEIEPIKRGLVGSITNVLNSGNETFGLEAQKAYAQYVKLREANPHVAAAYYGEHATRLEGLYNDIKAGMAPEGAFRARFSGPAARADFSKDQMKQALKVVGENQNWFMRQFTGTQKMGPGQQRRITNEIAEDVKQWYGANGDFEKATQLALKAAKRNGLEVMGGFAWRNDKNQKPLEDFLMKQHPNIEASAVGSDKINEEFYHAVNDKLYGDSGILTDTASDVAIFRMADKAGVPQFRLQAVTADGEVKDAMLSGTDVFINMLKRKEKARTSTFGVQDRNLRFGPENRFQPKEGAKSIYDY